MTTHTTKNNFAIVSKLIVAYNQSKNSNVPSLLDMCIAFTSYYQNLMALPQLNEDIKDRKEQTIFFKTLPSIVTRLEDEKCKHCFKGRHATFKQEYNTVFFTPTGAFYAGENGYFSHYDTIRNPCTICRKYPLVNKSGLK